MTPVPNQKDITEKDIKTRDGRTLRQFNEDPELRPDDSVTIELRAVDDVCVRYNLGPEALQNAAENDQNNPPARPDCSARMRRGNRIECPQRSRGCRERRPAKQPAHRG